MDTTSEFAVVRAPLPDPKDLAVTGLGPCQVPSPLDPRGTPFVDESRRVLTCSDTVELLPYLDSCTMPPAFEPAGARQKLFFDPATVTAGIVTCGGLCPGLNDVIRSVVMTLTYTYGVERILGFCYGYAGLARNPVEPPMELTPRDVEDAHQKGGSLLGSSRGPQDPAEMLDTLVARGVSVLFTIGGDGTLRGAAALAKEIAQRGLAIGVIGIPKTIDNDLAWTVRSFGFSTAVEEGRKAIEAAHSEARGARNGVGLVKLMGRHSTRGPIRAGRRTGIPGGATETAGGEASRRRGGSRGRGPGSPRAGTGRAGRIGQHQAGRHRGAVARRDPAAFRPARHPGRRQVHRPQLHHSMDSEFCLMLGQDAVHAGMAGRTNMVVGFWNRHFTHVPIPVAVATRKQLDPEGAIWQGVLKATGQPASMAG